MEAPFRNVSSQPHRGGGVQHGSEELWKEVEDSENKRRQGFGTRRGGSSKEFRSAEEEPEVARRQMQDEDLGQKEEALQESVARETDPKETQCQALDEEVTAQKQRVEQGVRAHAAYLMKEVEQKRLALQSLENEILQRRIALNELKVQENIRLKEVATHQQPQDRTLHDPQPLQLPPPPTSTTATPERLRQQERLQERQADRAVQLELECSRLGHALQKGVLRARELERALAQAQDLAKAACEERDRVAEEMAKLNRAIGELRDRAGTVNDARRRAMGPSRVVPPHMEGCLRTPPSLVAIQEALEAQLNALENCEAAAEDAALRSRREAEGKLRAQAEVLRNTAAVLQESERMRTLLETTLKAENAARLRAEDRARGLEVQLQKLRGSPETEALQSQGGQVVALHRQSCVLEELLRADTAAAPMVEGQTATAAEDAARQQLQEMETRLQLVEAALEAEQAEGRRLARELAEAQSKLVNCDAEKPTRPEDAQALALRESETMRELLEATLLQEKEAKRQAQGRIKALEDRLQQTQNEAEGRLLMLLGEKQRDEGREAAERRAMEMEMARLEAEQRFQEASRTVARLQEEGARHRGERREAAASVSEVVALEEKVETLQQLEQQLRDELREQELVNTRTQALIREELEAKVRQLERQLTIGAPSKAHSVLREATLQERRPGVEPHPGSEETCQALQRQVEGLDTRLQEQLTVERQLREQLKEHDLLSTRAQALVREEMQTKVERLQRQLSAPRAAEDSNALFHLKLSERRLKEKELAHRRLGFQLQDREVELRLLQTRLGHREEIEAQLVLATQQLAKREEDIGGLQRLLRREELLRNEQLAHAMGADAEEGPAVQQAFLRQLDGEVATVKEELREAREKLATTHLSFLHRHERLAALEEEQRIRQLAVKALADEVEAKRETILKMMVEPAKNLVASSTAQALERQLAALRADVQATAMEGSRARLALQGVEVEQRQAEAALLEKHRQLTALGLQVEDTVAQLRVVEADLQFKRRQRLEVEPQAGTEATGASPPLTAAPSATSAAKSPALLVTVVNAQDLLPLDHLTRRSNPFLVVQFGSEARQTAVLHDTLDPCWDETFEFTAGTGRMEFMLWDDALGRSRESMGTASLGVDEPLLQMAGEGAVKRWVPLTLRAREDAGGVHVVLQLRGAWSSAPSSPPGTVAAPQFVTSAQPLPIKPLAQPAPMGVADPCDVPARTSSTASGQPASPTVVPQPTPKPPRSEVVTLEPQPDQPYVDYAETTSREPSLHFKEPNLKFLRVRVLEGVVPMMDWDGLCDPFVCVDTGLQRWDSAVIKETLTPGWYQEAVLGCYDLQQQQHWGLQLPEELARDELQLTVYDWNLTKDRRIGFIRLRFCDIPGYEGDDIIDPPAPHWYEAERHFGLLTTVVNSDFGQWVGSFVQDERTKACMKQQRRKMAVINALKSGIGHLGNKVKDMKCGMQAVLGHPEVAVQDSPLNGPNPRNVPVHLFKTEEERRLEAIIPENLRDDDPLVHGDRNLCSIKAQIWFDNTYTPPPRPILGQLCLKLSSVTLQPRANNQPRAPLVIIHYDCHWVRVPTVFANSTSMFDQEFLFGVTEPSAPLTLAVFDDCSDRVLSKEPKFMGLLRIRPTCLNHNQRYTTTLPLHHRYKGDVLERGRVSFSVSLRLQSMAPVVVSMFRPPMKGQYYYSPLTEFRTLLAADGPVDFETPIRLQQYRRLQQVMEKQGPGWSAKVLANVSPPPIPQFDLALLLANVKRLKDGFRTLVAFAHYLEYICLWTNWQESVAVNLLLVVLVWFSEWIPTVVLLFLLWSFALGFLRRQQGSVVVPMATELFGKVLNQQGEAAPIQAEDSDHEEEHDEVEDGEEKETSAWEDIQKLVGVATQVQEAVGMVASLVEQVEALAKWRDPRISGLLSAVFLILIPGLYYIPLRLVLSFIILFALRHPRLRDPIPPPPANLLQRLPTRAPLLLPRTRRSKLAFIDPNAC